MARSYKIIGLMSGSSLDGIDLADCYIEHYDNVWHYSILNAKTYPYKDEWKTKLDNASTLDAEALSHFNIEYGKLLGTTIKEFTGEFNIDSDYVAVHGHTVFHQPDKGLTIQAGDAATISSVAGLPVIYNFRSKDVSLGGQGAPLVPVCDELLFGEYDYCLNLGGFGNISYKVEGKRTAFDLCPVNNALNYLAGLKGLEYDKGGKLSHKGKVDRKLLQELDTISWYSKEPPKSLGKEWLTAFFLPILDSSDIPLCDKLRTVTEHIIHQICSVPGINSTSAILVTGGGAHNDFLMERLAVTSGCKLSKPGKQLIDFKEAMAFAFLGALRLEGSINVYSSVTGAIRDSCAGSVIL